jgi:HD-GYP domain-containing protein (c-di-GMP phosphodiesterase class II)
MPPAGHSSSRLVRPHGGRAAPGDLRFSHVLGGLSAALDLAEGHPAGHAARAALIGLKLSRIIGFNESEQAALLVTMLVKDLGASANAARFVALFGADDHDVKAALRTVDWGRALEAVRFTAGQVRASAGWSERGWRKLAAVTKGPAGVKDITRARANQGAELARELALSNDSVQAIRAVDEHWNGKGAPLGLSGHAIHPFARVATLAQTMEVFWRTGGPRAALEVAAARRGQWFEPALVDALVLLKTDEAFWQELASNDVLARVLALEPDDRASKINAEGLDLVAEVFARVIDAKSPWTLGHSAGVADLSVRIANRLGLSDMPLVELRRAALLHDIGKLGVSNVILDKPGALSGSERIAVERHTAGTESILSNVEGFNHLASLAASHHERLDGRGYHRHLSSGELSLPARVLALADIADALRTSRPYRPGLSPDRLLAVVGREVGTGVDSDCYRALADVLGDVPASHSPDVPVVHVVPALIEDYTQAA